MDAVHCSGFEFYDTNSPPKKTLNHFDGDHGLLHMIEALESLAEATRAQLIQNFESIGKMILDYNLIIAALIVETKVVTQ